MGGTVFFHQPGNLVTPDLGFDEHVSIFGFDGPIDHNDIFGDIVNKKMAFLKEKYDDAQKKTDVFKQQKEEAKRNEEEAKRNEEAVIIKSVIKFSEKGFSKQEISESLEISVDQVNEILSEN